MTATQRVDEVSLGTQSIERFSDVLTPELWEKVEKGAGHARELFEGRTLWNINSTARGGGVAEMLLPLLSYAKGIGLDAKWLVIGGDDPFFAVTKRIHNRLHGAEGDGGSFGDDEREAYEATIEANAAELVDRIGERDAVILHDPQTAGLVPRIKARGAVVIWRCHVGLDTPNDFAREAWEFLRPYVIEADKIVFSREAFVWDDLPDEKIVCLPPSIDAFAPKNAPLDGETVDAIMRACGLRHVGEHAGGDATYVRMDGSEATIEHRAEILEEAPLPPDAEFVLQVSRWDKLKDPLGVIDGFAEHVAGHCDAHLVYAGPATGAVSDDPEGAAVLEAAYERWRELPAEARERIHLALLPMDDLEENAAIVNALQRAASVVVQKSLAEGFGLTVAEAMWKSRAVVASRIGGIQDQIDDGHCGILLDDPSDLAAYGAAVRELLEDPERREEMGRLAADRVRERFLGTHSLLGYLEVLAPLLRA